MQSKSELANKIISWGNYFESTLEGGLKIPEGYCFHKNDRTDYLWFLGCPIKSTESGLSWYVNKPMTDYEKENNIDHLMDEKRVEIMVRIFWPESEYIDGKRKHIIRRHSGNKFSAFITISKGIGYAFKSKRLNTENEDTFLYDEDLTSLANRCAEKIERIGLTAIPLI